MGLPSLHGGPVCTPADAVRVHGHRWERTGRRTAAPQLDFRVGPNPSSRADGPTTPVSCPRTSRQLTRRVTATEPASIASATPRRAGASAVGCAAPWARPTGAAVHSCDEGMDVSCTREPPGVRCRCADRARRARTSRCDRSALAGVLPGDPRPPCTTTTSSAIRSRPSARPPLTPVAGHSTAGAATQTGGRRTWMPLESRTQVGGRRAQCPRDGHAPQGMAITFECRSSGIAATARPAASPRTSTARGPCRRARRPRRP